MDNKEILTELQKGDMLTMREANNFTKRYAYMVMASAYSKLNKAQKLCWKLFGITKILDEIYKDF